MKTLALHQHRAELEARLTALSPDDPAIWGRMTSSEAVCHLREAFRMALGELTGIVPAPAYSGRLLKFMALRVPLQWMRNLPTVPQLAVGQLAVGQGAVRPASFAMDRSAMLSAYTRFIAEPDNRTPHPYFGAMRHADWMRWGYLHTDHHLRQFGR